MKKINLTNGSVVAVDDCDFDELSKYKWHELKTLNTSYAYRTVQENKKQKAILMHRAIVNAQAGFIVDHVNGNGLDNTQHNLRLATHQQNMANRRKLCKATSKYKGVWWCKTKNRWKAAIHVNKNLYSLGRFNTEFDAAKAYDEAALKHFGPFALTNLAGRKIHV